MEVPEKHKSSSASEIFGICNYSCSHRCQANTKCHVLTTAVPIALTWYLPSVLKLCRMIVSIASGYAYAVYVMPYICAIQSCHNRISSLCIHI